MKYEFFYEDRVDYDIDEALDYYLNINPSLVEDFLDGIEEAKIKILNTPEGFEVKRPDIRTVLLKQFDYHIYYTIDGFQIIILAIFHAQNGQEKIDEI